MERDSDDPSSITRMGIWAPRARRGSNCARWKIHQCPFSKSRRRKGAQLGTRQLLETSGDLLLATDPDADRMGVVVRDGKRTVRLTGNQIACICLEHICTHLCEKGELPDNAGFIKTIVTTELFKRIAEDFGGTCVDVLTGFKYIAETIRLWENSFAGLQFIFGAEESCGYLFGTFVRDKDAISSCCLISEAAAVEKKCNQTLVDRLHAIYRKYGIHRESLTNLTFNDSPDSLRQTETLMKTLRNKLPSHIGGLTVVSLEDFANGTMPLPKSDVLRFWLSDGSKLVIRPSGTEPKIKIYAEVMGSTGQNIEESIRLCDHRLKHLVASFQSAWLS